MVRNFASDIVEDGNDRYGHGTHCAEIIERLGPLSQLFVAKLSDGQGVSSPSVITNVCISSYNRSPGFQSHS